jgi:hypothetical protein
MDGRSGIQAERCGSAGLYIALMLSSTDTSGRSTTLNLNHPFSTQFREQHGLGWFGSIALSPDLRTIVALSIC